MKPLFLDCQTTGMHPSTGALLELAWSSELGDRSFLLQLPDGASISHKVSEITGIFAEHLESSVDPGVALAALEEDLAALGEGAVIVAHYAQFERAFVSELFRRLRGRDLSWKFLCTHQLAKRFVPESPSRNIRALVSYLDLGSGSLQRAAQHVSATRLIWERLRPEFIQHGLHNICAFEEWLARTKPAKAEKIEYHIERLVRLSLPERPGIYRMVASDGKVLYVGKATSLRDRVNSYFRGKKGPGGKKREMLAQVRDIQITECASALEAALLENEEIKRLNPPYNTSLKAARRELRFFSRDFSSVSNFQDAQHLHGPVGVHNSIELLGLWHAGALGELFHDEISPELLLEGQTLFLSDQAAQAVPSVRSLLSYGLRCHRWLRNYAPDDPIAEEVEEEQETIPKEEVVTAADVAGRFANLTFHAAREYLRASQLTRLLDCRVNLDGRELLIRGGAVEGASMNPAETPWSGLGITDYDRMSVLLTEVTRQGYPVESLRGA